MIEDCDNVDSVILLIQKPYKLAFLNRIKQYISMKTFSEWLGEIWVTVENPNMDAMISIDTLLEWFTEADKTVLMSSDELKTYNNLPDEVQIYRGVGEKSNPKGLSWTLNIEKAKWFADRYKKGYVLTALAKKKDILAYFAGRKEEEVIIDGRKLDAKKLVD